MSIKSNEEKKYLIKNFNSVQLPKKTNSRIDYNKEYL
jgi:hypothetical protein